MQTNKRYIVRFSNAYHGHLTGSTNFVNSLDVGGSQDNHFIYLKEMDDETLKFLEEYHWMIAGVIVNPMMYFTGVNQVSSLAFLGVI